MKRVLALVVAVALVSGAWYVRTQVIDKPADERVTTSHSDGKGPRVACVPELSGVCDALNGQEGVQVAPQPVDLDDAATASKDIDAWLAFGPSPEMANFDNPTTSYGQGVVIGQARVAALVPAPRAAALMRSCRGPVSWSCIARRAGRSWPEVDRSSGIQGAVNVGIGRPRSALGAILLGPLAVGSADVGDPRPSDVSARALRPILDATDDGSDTAAQVQKLVTQGPATFSVVAAPEGLARKAEATVRGRQYELTVLYPAPVATVSVVLAPVDRGGGLDRVVEMLRSGSAAEAVKAAGWTPSDSAAKLGPPGLDPGFLYGVHQKVR